MRTSIIQIGDSQGVILPLDVLRQLNLGIKSTVNVLVDNNEIIIKSPPRQGWAEAFSIFAESGKEEPLLPDFFEDENLSWWTWDKKKQ
jgi:antitoxin component of MazEF toxin-antitoxin module